MAMLARPVRSMPSSLRKCSTDPFIFFSRSRRTSLTMASSGSDDFGPDRLAADGPQDGVLAVEGENDDGQVVVLAERDGGRVHDLQALLEDVDVLDPPELPGRRVGH